MSTISIITVCYNSEKTIEKTIQSVLSQTHPVDEYIIVDGSSTDKTMEIVTRYIPDFGGRLRFVSEPDKGIYDAMNKGIAMAGGDLIGIINSDDYYEPTAAESILKHYHDEPFAVLYGKMRIHSPKGAHVEFIPHENLPTEMICHPTCFVTRKTYAEYGCFDLNYCSVADYDLMLRYYEIPGICFIPISEIISNFTMGGMSSSQRAYFDLLKLQVNRGIIRKRTAIALKIKAKVSSFLHPVRQQ